MTQPLEWWEALICVVVIFGLACFVHWFQSKHY